MQNLPLSNTTSEQTAPAWRQSLLSGSVAHASRHETEGSTPADVSSTASVQQPPVPSNTPQSQSVVTETEHPDLDQATALLRSLTAGGSSAPSLVTNEPTQSQKMAASSSAAGASLGHYAEHNLWESDAEEALARALKRLAVLARDENQADPSRSVARCFSERLGKVVKEGEIEFDLEWMK